MSFVIYTLYPSLSLGTNDPAQMHLATEDMHIDIIIHLAKSTYIKQNYLQNVY